MPQELCLGDKEYLQMNSRAVADPVVEVVTSTVCVQKRRSFNMTSDDITQYNTERLTSRDSNSSNAMLLPLETC